MYMYDTGLWYTNRVIVHCTVCPIYTSSNEVLLIFIISEIDFSLFLTGPLTSVLNLETDSGGSSINVSWEAPFTLDVTDEDPGIWYSVLIYNVTDEENPTAVPCTNCRNLTQTHYIFSPDYPSPCHKYTFAIIPHNGVGEGETSENVTGYSINSEFCVRTIHSCALWCSFTLGPTSVRLYMAKK